MKLRTIASVCGLGLCLCQEAFADETAENALFSQNTDGWRRSETQKVPEVTEQMKKAFPPAALRNILEAENAFCYSLTAATPDYGGYTLDGFAVTGFCGILPEVERNLFIDNFLKNEAAVSNDVAQCVIQPRLMMRFVRGVDYTDILYASPCSSFTLFYGGRIKSFNTAPSAELLDQLIAAYEKNRVDFVSPALIDQVLPIGVPQTEEQKKKVRELNIQKPVRSWATDQQPAAATPAESSAPKGWNKIKLGK
jgi:hypothetical protein